MELQIRLICPAKHMAAGMKILEAYKNEDWGVRSAGAHMSEDPETFRTSGFLTDIEDAATGIWELRGVGENAVRLKWLGERSGTPAEPLTLQRRTPYTKW